MNIRLIQVSTAGTATVYLADSGLNAPQMEVQLTDDENTLVANSIALARIEGCSAIEIDPLPGEPVTFSIVCFGEVNNFTFLSAAVPATISNGLTAFWNRCLALATAATT